MLPPVFQSILRMHVCVCVCVCVRERERKREVETEKEVRRTVHVVLHEKGGGGGVKWASCILFNMATHTGSTISEVGVRDSITYKLTDQSGRDLRSGLVCMVYLPPSPFSKGPTSKPPTPNISAYGCKMYFIHDKT